MPRPKATLAVAVLLALGAAGCDTYYNRIPSPDDLMHAVPWFDHMIASRAVHPYETAGVPRNAVPGTVPVTGGELDWGAEWRAGNAATADRLGNPTDGTPTARGDSLYATFCALCHGAAGAGDGLVGRKMGAPAITTDRARALTDGYIYSLVRYGRGVMAPYGDKLYEPLDRWAVVNVVRKLQVGGGRTP